VFAIALFIFGGTLALALLRPRVLGFEIHHGWAAWIGLALSIGVLLVPPSLAVNTLVGLAPPLVTLAALMVMTAVAERAGLLRLMARRLAHLAGGDARRLFTLLFFAGAITGTVFTNDAAVLLFTPLAVRLVAEVGDDTWSAASGLPFYFAILHVGNLAGALVISNPINLVVASLFDIGFSRYAVWMVLPALVSAVVTYVCLRWFFRRTLPRHCRTGFHAPPRPYDAWMLRLCIAVLCLTLVLLFASDLAGLSTWPAALLGALVLLTAHGLRGGSVVEVVRRGVGWDALAFVTGIFVVVLGLRNAGLAERIGDLLRGVVGEGGAALIYPIAFLSGGMSSLMNNHPTAGLMAWVIDDLRAGPISTEIAVYAALIGGDLGPKMLPVGSLAALMWFRMLRDRGIEVRYLDYIRIGVPTALLAIAAAAATLHLEVWLAGVLRR
jgi:arsenical pump membrane protein